MSFSTKNVVFNILFGIAKIFIVFKSITHYDISLLSISTTNFLSRGVLKNMALDYQENVWELQKEVFKCVCLKINNEPTCFHSFNEKEVSKSIFPDGIFVGKNYGKLKPKILFIGNNPNSSEFDFGNPNSLINGMRRQISDVTAHEYQKYYFSGIPNRGFYGFTDFPLYTDQNWSITRILKFLFPDEPDLLEGFAFTNAILCKGKLSEGRADPIMRNNCIRSQQWLRKTIEILEPDIIFIFSISSTNNSTWTDFSIENGVVDGETELNPEKSFAYYTNYEKRFFKSGKKSFESLVIGIPHLTTPKFETWIRGVPHIFREIFPLSKQEIISRILNSIRIIISAELNLKSRREQLKDVYNKFWTIFYNRYRKLNLENVPLRNFSPKTSTREKNLGVGKDLTLYFYIEGIKEQFDESDTDVSELKIGVNLYSRFKKNSKELKVIYDEFKKKFREFQNTTEMENILPSPEDQLVIHNYYDFENDKAYYIAEKSITMNYKNLFSSIEAQEELIDEILILFDRIYPFLKNFTNDFVKTKNYENNE